MSHDAEHDDLDGRGVVVNWEDEIKKPPNFGSFGAVYEGKLMLEGGGHVDVVVKVSVAVLETGGQSSSPALLNDTLRYVFSLHRPYTRRDMNQRDVCNSASDALIHHRYEAELLRQLHFTPEHKPRDTPSHIINQLFFCNYCHSLHKAYAGSEEFRAFWC